MPDPSLFDAWNTPIDTYNRNLDGSRDGTLRDWLARHRVTQHTEFDKRKLSIARPANRSDFASGDELAG